ncbi:hypothetical protein LW858_23490 [Bacillus cereus]|uniref:hypothetical protein n=1 Tax=Bacillus cereus TaxID=1396 RepID=UPI001F1FA70A|nr:hypothetical protein [Bacillus cereus]MDA2566587.1 hypothetical protein [Bacillus cereus]MDA2571702.1 hypothetical protein [Bacillus cereus]UIJ65821.1 hypothetical protein LW858_23490 [Bacillus cereus]
MLLVFDILNRLLYAVKAICYAIIGALTWAGLEAKDSLSEIIYNEFIGIPLLTFGITVAFLEVIHNLFGMVKGD